MYEAKHKEQDKVQFKRQNVAVKYLVVPLADTVVDPLAVVVEAVYASVALVTVSRMHLENCFARGA